MSLENFGSRLSKNILGKRATCIAIADTKQESFSVHSPHDVQSRLVVPQNYSGIKLRSFASLRTVRVLNFSFKMNMQF